MTELVQVPGAGRVSFAPGVREAYERFTFPAFRTLLKEGAGEAVAVGLEIDGTPAGLGLARRNEGEPAEILSLFVERAHRKQGHGGRLLARLEGECAARGAGSLQIRFNEAGGSAAAMAQLLARQGWSPLQPRMLLARMPAARAVTAPWYNRRLPAGYSVFPWAELTGADREEMEADADAGRLPRGEVWAFTHDPGFEPLNSLGLRCGGKIAGWMITHRIAPKVIRYSAQFVRREFQTGHVGLALVAEAVRRHVAILGLDSLGTFGIAAHKEQLIRVFVRQMAPFCESYAFTMESLKTLTPLARVCTQR